MSILQAKEGGAVYDYAWYPFMNSQVPESCIFVSTSRDQPVHMWDAYTGDVRPATSIYDTVWQRSMLLSYRFSNTLTCVIPIASSFARRTERSTTWTRLRQRTPWRSTRRVTRSSRASTA